MTAQTLPATTERTFNDLPRNARQVLAELELLSHGKWNTSGRHADATALLRQGESMPAHLEWRAGC